MLLKTLFDERKQDIQRTQANPKLDTILSVINDYAQLCIRAAGEKYSVQLSKGRRQCDGPDEYHALVVKEEGSQIGSIPLRQDKYGKLGYNVQRPLYGAYDKDMEFTPENWKYSSVNSLKNITRVKLKWQTNNSHVG